MEFIQLFRTTYLKKFNMQKKIKNKNWLFSALNS